MSCLTSQAGINTIRLIENKDVSLTYYASGVLINTGTSEIIQITNDEEIKFNFSIPRNSNNRGKFLYNLNWFIYELSESNDELIQQITKSIYGWLAELTFYNGDKKLINVPMFYVNSNMDQNISNHYNINLTNRVPSEKMLDVVDQSQWILANNQWDDTGVWEDGETWND